jgi:hypothetical protein
MIKKGWFKSPVEPASSLSSAGISSPFQALKDCIKNISYFLSVISKI